MFTLLRTPRWIGFTALVLGAIIGFGLLSNWQFTRAEERREQRSAMESATSATVNTLAQAMSAPAFTSVTLTGTYLPETVLVRNRPLDGGNGYWVMSPWQEASSGTQAWVLRGWIPATGSATTSVDAPPPLASPGELRGVTRLFEESGPLPSDLPRGQVQAVSVTQLGAPVTPLWIQSTEAKAPLTPVPLPTIDEGRNISYAWQWLLFSAIALGGWFIFLRREAASTTSESATP